MSMPQSAETKKDIKLAEPSDEQAADSSQISDPKPRPVSSIILSVGVILAGLIGFAMLQILSPKPQQNEPAQTGAIVRTEKVEVRSGALSVLGSGFARPRAEISLAAQVAGEVIEVSPSLVAGGTFVAGDVLLRLDQRPYVAALNQALAALQAAESNRTFLTKQIERTKALTDKGFNPQEKFDQRVNELAQTEAEVERLKAVIVETEINLERTIVKAPFNGQTRAKSVDVGSVVQPGTPLANLYAVDYFEIVVPMELEDALLIPQLWTSTGTVHAPAQVVAQYGQQRFYWDAHVERAEAGIDETTRTVDVVVRIADPLVPGKARSSVSPKKTDQASPPLLEGTFVDVIIEGRHIERQVIVPRKALKNGSNVWIAEADNRLSIQPVRVIVNRNETVVLEAPNIANDSDVIVSNLDIVVDGMSIRRGTSVKDTDDGEASP